MKALAFGFVVAVVIITGFFSWYTWSSANALAIGNLWILSLTLIVLVWYGLDTNTMARITQERWLREGVLSTAYNIPPLKGTKGDAGQTVFQLHNPSPLLVYATVNCNFRIYDEPVEYHPLYAGKERWLVFPQQFNQGGFDLESVLQKKGKTVSVMMAESTPINREHQLTMFLELHFEDELGQRRTLPGRHHYFDFNRWAWIPHLSESQPAGRR